MSAQVGCTEFPCVGVVHQAYVTPDVEVRTERVRIAMVSEAAPQDSSDWYYAAGDPLFARTTVQAFRDAGADVDSIGDVLDLGVYLTAAVKCGKSGCAIKAAPIRECSRILEQELTLLPELRVILAMGDVAIAAINAIARRAGEARVIPAGSTYRIRGGEFAWRGIRVLPSYLQAGPSFFIEKSKRRMIAQDIATALEIAAR